MSKKVLRRWKKWAEVQPVVVRLPSQVHPRCWEVGGALVPSGSDVASAVCAADGGVLVKKDILRKDLSEKIKLYLAVEPIEFWLHH